MLKLNTLATWSEESTWWKNPDALEDWRQKETVLLRMRWLYGTTESMDMNSSKLQEIVENRGAWDAAAHGVAESQTWLSDWTFISIAVSVAEKSKLYEYYPFKII